MKERLKSWVFWSSLAAQVVSILVACGAITPEASEAVRAAVVAALQIFVCFGVLNNPTDRENF